MHVAYRIGSILLKFGIAFPKSHTKMKTLFQWLAEHGEPIPPMLLLELRDHHDFYLKLNQLILTQDKKLKEIVDHDKRAQLLKTIPGVGTLTARRCISDISNAADFKNGRHLAAWIGLVPRQFSTGGKPTLLGISKRGNKGLRELLILGARAVLVWPEKAVIAVAVELIRGPIVYALQRYDFLVIVPINPTTIAKYRTAFKPSKAKEDHTDVEFALELMLRYPNHFPPLNQQSVNMRKLMFLVVHRRKVVDDKQRVINQMINEIKQYYRSGE
jgi:hypothetical protein